MSAAGLAGSFWPSERQELLLRTAFGDDEAAAHAWDDVRDRLELDTLEAGTYPLLPLVHRTLARLGVDDPAVPRLAGIRKRTWTLNRLQVDAAAGALAALEAVGVQPIVVGGWEIPIRYLDDLGLRPLAEPSVLLRAEHLAAAAGALRAAGFAGPESSARQRFRFANEQGHACILRLRLAGEFSKPEDDLDDVLAGAGKTTLDAATLRVLAPADELVAVCLDGARATAVPYVLWIADALAVLARDDAEVDWHGVVDRGRRLRATPRLHDALVYLRRLGADVPVAVIDELAAVPTRPRARLAYRTALGDGRMRTPQALTRFLQVTADRSLPRALLELPAVLRDELGVDTRAQVPAALLRRLRPRREEPVASGGNGRTAGLAERVG